MQMFLLFLTLGAACILLSADGANIAFAFAGMESNPSTYPANPNYSYNAGLPVDIERSGIGNYKVYFYRLVGSGTNAQVTMHSGPNVTGWCNLHRIHPSGGLPPFTLRVKCWDETGSPADRKFLVLVIEGCGSTDEDYISYARLNQPTSPMYTAAMNWKFGAGTFVTMSAPPGLAVSNMGPVANAGAAVLATTYGTDRYCTIVDWGMGDVKVSCWNDSVALQNSRSNVLAIKAGFPHVSFARNEGIGAGVLNPAYSYSSDGSAQSISGGGGVYSVFLGPEADVGGHVQVVAYNSDANCYVGFFGGGTVRVVCARDGSIVGSPFVVLAIA